MIEYGQTVLWPDVATDEPVLRAERLSSLLKWAGGKEQELKHILPMIPSFDAYYEHFVGGGAIFFSIQSHRDLMNDKSPHRYNFHVIFGHHNADLFRALASFLLACQQVIQI